MNRKIKTALIDFIDDAYPRFTRRDRLPPFPSTPEAVLAYQEAWLREAVEQVGLRIDRICRGSWTHRDDTLASQDIVVLAKP